jgi:hypothetical protein
MKKRLLLILVLAAVCIPTAMGQLANRNKEGLDVYSIQRILRLDEDEIDLGTAALVISRNWGADKTLYRYRDKLDDMAKDILKRLGDKNLRVDFRAIEVINNYLFEELGYQTVETAEDPEDLFLHTVIDQKRGYCLSLSMLYLAIGERLDLPLYGVVVPGHFFVRYDDKIRSFNIETTSKGRNAPDKHYIEKFKPPRSKNSIYMKNLTRKQTLGCFLITSATAMPISASMTSHRKGSKAR